MTDKFVVSANEIGEIIVTDVETDRVYRYGDISKFFGLIRLLNEQQSTINKLKEENEQLKEEIEPLKQKEEVLNKIWRTYLENHE